MNMGRADLTDAKKEVRAVLVSKVGGVRVSDFQKDFRRLIGHTLKYDAFGYRTLVDLLKAMPDVVTVKYCEKDKTDKLFAIGDPNTYRPSFVKKAEAQVVEGHLLWPNEADYALLPNSKGLYAICFPKDKAPSLSVEAIDAIFSQVGQVEEISLSERFVFIRYKEKQQALKAMQFYGDEYDVRIPQEKKGPRGFTKQFARRPERCMGKENNVMGKEVLNNEVVDIYLGRLPVHWTDDQIRDLVKKYQVMKFRPVQNDDRRFAFISVSAEDGRRVIEDLHNQSCEGQKLVVQLARNNKKQGESDKVEDRKLLESMTRMGISDRTAALTKLDYEQDPEELDSSRDSGKKFDNVQVPNGEQDEGENMWDSIIHGSSDGSSSISPHTREAKSDPLQQRDVPGLPSVSPAHSGHHSPSQKGALLPTPNMAPLSIGIAQQYPYSYANPAIRQSYGQPRGLLSCYGAPPYGNVSQYSIPTVQHVGRAPLAGQMVVLQPNLYGEPQQYEDDYYAEEDYYANEYDDGYYHGYDYYDDNCYYPQEDEADELRGPQLIVKDFTYGTHLQWLSSIFDQYRSSCVKIINDHPPGRSEARVYFSELKHAKQALEMDRHFDWNGRIMSVTLDQDTIHMDPQGLKEVAKRKPLRCTVNMVDTTKEAGSARIVQEAGRTDASVPTRCSPEGGSGADPKSFTTNRQPQNDGDGPGRKMNGERVLSGPMATTKSREPQTGRTFTRQAGQNVMTEFKGGSQTHNQGSVGHDIPKELQISRRHHVQQVCFPTKKLTISRNLPNNVKLVVTHPITKEYCWGHILTDDWSEIRQLKEIMEKLMDPDNMQSYKNNTLRCAAPFMGEYYRALVKKISQQKALVFFIDYGNESEVSVADLHGLPDNFWELPAHAVPVKVTGCSQDLELLASEMIMVDAIVVKNSPLAAEGVVELKIVE